ncbi:MAG TPA: ATP-binding protein [Pyrinomonadaceae bacterium]|nr:ATP-binding protein [Pyrinomonadaceae bacterium]
MKTDEREPPDDAARDDRSTSPPAPPPVETEDHSTVVYRRIDAEPAQSPAQQSSPQRNWVQRLAPAVTPLVLGFLVLLILISVVGFLSVRRMDEVSIAVLGLEQQHAAKLSLLLKLRLAVTKLNNEARARADSEARREMRPPIDMRLNRARDELKELMPDLERALIADPSWQKFKNDLTSFVEVTNELRRYSLEGFERFDVVDKELDALLQRSNEEQFEVFRQSEILEQNAARSIRTWSMIALIMGALVAAGTIWEVQRRFGEMRQSVEEARRERVFTSQLLEGMVSAVAAVDGGDRIRSANAAFFKIFPGASIGASIHEKIGSQPALKMLEAATGSRVERSIYRGRWVVPAGAPDEGEQSFDVYSSPLAIDSARGQILTLVDVTEAAEAERGLRRQESLAAVGQATAQVAHEIRNPLGSIRLGVSMLRDNVSDAEGLNTIELVERGILHLNKLVVDVAQFSSRKALARSNVSIREVINRSLEFVADKIRESDARVERKFSDQALMGNWDPDQLSQVFVNVVANAIDASPKGASVVISTETVSVDGGDDLAPRRYGRVTIADQGMGMDKAALERIFEPFFSTKKRGTGLGLAIVKQIVEQHGGTIDVESSAGNGTKFRIDLPL